MSRPSIRVRAKLFATLGRYRPGDLPGTPFDVDLADGDTVATLIDRLGVPPGEVKVVFVNGRTRLVDWPLSAGDEVGIFPPVGGG